jgi:putative NADH-flavin reductase
LRSSKPPSGWLDQCLDKKIRQPVFELELAICRDYLDWTIVRPPRLTNGSLTQKYRVMEDRLPEGRMTVSRADVADFMLHEVEKPAHRQQIVGVAG